MIRKLLFATLAAAVLSACTTEADFARMRAVQDRELQLPFDVCIRHALGEEGLEAELLGAGYQLEESGSYRREFDDLDMAITAQGAVTVTLTDTCALFIPIHVIALRNLDIRIFSQLEAHGYQPIPDQESGFLNFYTVIYANEQSRLSVNVHATSYMLLGVVTTITFKPI